MKLSLYLALKNLYRNKKYSIGLFIAYLVTSVVCIGFFLFYVTTADAYDSILNRQVSSSYVSLVFGYSEKELLDLTPEQLNAIENIDDVKYIEKHLYVPDVCNLSLNGNAFVHIDVSLIASQFQNVSPSYKKEFGEISQDKLFVCGREIDTKAQECLVSSAFVSFFGATSAEQLLGKTLSLSNSINQVVAQNLRIVGILHESLSLLSDMKESGKYFIFTVMDTIENTSTEVYFYKAYADYSALPALQKTIDDFSLENSYTMLGNNSYAMKKLSDTTDFISAVLVLIAILCMCMVIAFVSSSAVFRFMRTQTFYTAAFAVGLSKRRLALCFLFEFIIVALAAFLWAVPLAMWLIKLLSYLVYVFAGIKYSAVITLQPLLISIIPILLSACISSCFVWRILNRN